MANEWRRTSSAVSWSAYMALRNSTKGEDVQTARYAANARPVWIQSKCSEPEGKRKSRWGEIAVYVYAMVVVIFICASMFCENPSVERSELSHSEGRGASPLPETQGIQAVACASSWCETFTKELRFQVLLDFLVGI
eukprot:3666575-Rhodomonas_salina.1